MEWFIRLAEWVKRRYFPIQYDASCHPAETYYASIYLELIEHYLKELGSGPFKILDAGCGTGRLLVPLARLGHQLTGIDFHRDSLRLCRDNAGNARVHVELIDGNLGREIERFPDDTFDAAMAIEVLYISRVLPQMMAHLSRLVRRGGLLFVTHRTRFYYLLQCLRRGKFEDAYFVSMGKEGRLPKGQHRIFYNWQSAADIDDLYDKAGMNIVMKYPIGPYSGFAPDPLEVICDPQKLSKRERELLRKIEMNFDAETLMASRYVLVIAQK